MVKLFMLKQMKHQIKVACAPTMDACMSNYSKTLISYVTTVELFV